MKVRRSLLRYLRSTLNQNLPYLIIFYILNLVLFLLLTGRDYTFRTFQQGSVNPLVFLPLIIFSVYLLGIFIINLVHLWGKEARFGLNLIRKRMIQFFVVLILLSTIPQALLSYRLNRSALDFWLDRDLQDVLERSLDSNLNNYQKALENLDRFHRNGTFDNINLSSMEQGLEIWENLTRFNGGIDAMQVILKDGSTWLLGDESARVPVSPGSFEFEGFLARRDLDDFSLLSYQFSNHGEEGEYAIILTSFYAREYNELGGHLSRMLDKMEDFGEFRSRGGRETLINQFFFILPLLLLSINIGFALSESITTPLNRLIRAMEQVAQGDYQYRLTEGFSKELTPMVGSFNQMVNELELSRAKEEQAGRVGAWKDLAQQLAHEIRNPLTPIKLSAQRVLRKASQIDCDEDLIAPAMERIITEVDGLDYLLREFREFAGQREPQKEKLDLYLFLDELVHKYQAMYEKVNIQLQGDGAVFIMADKSQLTQVMTNLMDNAINAMNKEGNLNLGVYHLARGNMAYARVIVQDSGPGIAQEEQDKIFQPYFTTREEGTGLGLAIVERIMNDHKGRIWLVSTQEGTTFSLDLPAGESDEEDTDN